MTAIGRGWVNFPASRLSHSTTSCMGGVRYMFHFGAVINILNCYDFLVLSYYKSPVQPLSQIQTRTITYVVQKEASCTGVAGFSITDYVISQTGSLSTPASQCCACL